MLTSDRIRFSVSRLLFFAFLVCATASTAFSAEERTIEADLLIVGGTESGCAAAVQAARMGVKRIVIVNDIEWLGGQFSAEALVAIDENTYKTGVRHDQPIPRHGAFREIIERIEADNLKKYSVARPGNTRVITTCRPSDAARVFREWLDPFVVTGQIQIVSWHEPSRVDVVNGKVTGVRFQSRKDKSPLRVQARLTIDASDWGDVIRLSGASYEFGPDLKSKYDELLAPEKREGYPVTDMNPITYCMVVEETDTYKPIAQPIGYQPRSYREHRYPKDPLWLYGTRRVIDHYHFKQIQHPDVLLLCFPAFDYPLDVYPKSVAEELEKSSLGASKKNIVELTPDQRRIIFENAKHYSLGFLHFLQTEAHEKMPDKTHSFRRFKLSEEFGTDDKLPFKPYIRESLRLKAMYMMRQQDSTGVGGDSAYFARAMYHDSVAVWQFEYDFHPTRREFLEENNPAGPWRNGFRNGRTWGPPYSGRSVFPLRSLIPEKIDGLLGCQKNLGYSSIVSSAVRLHDQSMGIGQAVGACAGVSLLEDINPREIPFDRKRLLAVQSAVVKRPEDGHSGMLWPFKDLDPTHSSFPAVNMLAAQKCLPLKADEVRFRADEPVTVEWIVSVVEQTHQQMRPDWTPPEIPHGKTTRGEFAKHWWKSIQNGPWKNYVRMSIRDADDDGIPDVADALPLDAKNRSLPVAPISEDEDGLPNQLTDDLQIVRQFNFAARGTLDVKGFTTDFGETFNEKRGFGWSRDNTTNHRRRGKADILADTFQFTRSHEVWELILPNGAYTVEFSIGDSDHLQFGQNVTIEGQAVIRDHTTRIGRFAEKKLEVTINDGKLTVEIGLKDSSTNTCLNWLRVMKKK